MVKRAVAIAAVFAFFALVLPARGLTFLWDDWLLLARASHPASWFAPVNEHWKPLYCALFALERALFGANHTFFLLTTWAIHVVNLALLGSLLEKKTGDERAAAVSVLAFGLATSWREVLAWACLGGLAASFTVVLLGFHAAERVKAAKTPREERVFLALAALACFAAPLFFGSGLALGPALALELAPRRRALAPLAGFAVYAALYSVLGHAPAPASPLAAGRFVLDAVGLGLVRRTLLLPARAFPETPAVGATLALLYGAAVAMLAIRSSPAERAQVGRAQAWLLLVFGPIALARSTMPPLAAAWSRYQYFPALGWTWTLALALARRPRAQLLVALVSLPLAFAHFQAASEDDRLWAPRARRGCPALVQRWEELARTSSASLDREKVPLELALPGTSAREIVERVEGR